MSSRDVWAIRVLTGPQSGQIMPLIAGYNVIGRSTTCQIKLASNSVSKEHATVLVTDDGKVIISDMNSRNGTYVNGLRVQNQKLQAGDKISFHELVVDVVRMPPGTDARYFQNPGALQNPSQLPMPAWAGNAAVALQHQVNPQAPFIQPVASAAAATEPDNHDHVDPDDVPSGNFFLDFFGNIQRYIDQVAMPGVYAVIQKMNFRQGLLLLIGVYAIALTIVATLPMITMTKSSIRQESIRRAKTIARNMAAMNRQAILEKNEVAVSVRLAELEEGVSTAVIINRDGTIIAPANKRGEFAKMPFVSQARRDERESEAMIGDSNLGVAIPIPKYNAETGSQEAAAYAIVLYDMGTMAMSPAQTLGLILEISLLALVLGVLLFFFLNRVVEHPIRLLSHQLDDALREGRDDLSTPYNWPLLDKVISNVNSALARAASGGGNMFGGQQNAVLNRDIEASNIIRMLNVPALSINAIDDRIIATNGSFDQLIGMGAQLTGRSISEIPDQAMRENLRELIPKMRDQLAAIAYSHIPFAGENYEVNGQAIVGNSGEAAWYLVTLNRQGG